VTGVGRHPRFAGGMPPRGAAVLVAAVALITGVAACSAGPVPASQAASAPSPAAPATTAALTSTRPPRSDLSPDRPERAGGRVAVAAPRMIGPVPAGTPVTFGLALRMASEDDVARYLDGLYDPTSPEFHHFLTATQFGARFGLPLERVEAVGTWAAAHGFAVLGTSDQRTAIHLAGTAAQVTAVFGVHLGAFSDPASGAEFQAPLDVETVPAAIRDAVVGLSGLDTRPNRPAARELVARPGAAVPDAGLGPIDLAKAYDIVPLYEAGLLGDDQTIAIVSFDTFTPGDIARYDKEFGIDGPAVERISVGKPITKPGDGTVEVALDLEVIRAVAPHARILDFEGRNGDVDHADLIDAIVADGRASIVSDSWGKCDVAASFSAGSRARALHSLQAAAAAGISFFVASGDHGAFDCWSFDASDHRETVDFPSASPYTIAVGGTQLAVRTDGTYLSEAGWEDYLSTGGSGGGNNPIEKRPSWQVGPGVINASSNGKRQSPDVAASAAVDSAYQIYATSGTRGGHWSHVYGTSAAAPFWAASMLLVRQLAERVGVGPLGYVNPMLYALAASPQRDAIFHDVTRGGNLSQPAGPGWDYATGLGSPDVTALAGAIVGYLRDNPSR
jgi:subtilase family serine protease